MDIEKTICPEGWILKKVGDEKSFYFETKIIDVELDVFECSLCKNDGTFQVNTGNNGWIMLDKEMLLRMVDLIDSLESPEIKEVLDA